MELLSVDINQMVISRLDRNDQSLKELATSVSELAQAIVRKEVTDQHIAESLKAVKNDVDHLYEKTETIERQLIANGGDDVKNTAIRAAINFLVVVVCGAILWAVTKSYGA
jgi:hypothetical protein